ncbi:hypothetical protein [Orenia marismortui]|uniref:hypothetical protein n=1 Tax=Orenia marismortui TaxID=46469 RepID=UPI000362F430|nr:hypothetical protein [Orenia marismortui]
MRGIKEMEQVVDNTLNEFQDIQLIIHPDIILEKDIDKVIEMVLGVYENHNLILDELLSSIELQGLSLNDSVKVYAKLYKQIEDHEVIKLSDEETIKLWH